MDRVNELACSEAYQHGRTLERLRTARLALAQIATGKVTKRQAVTALAKWALELSAEDVEDQTCNSKVSPQQ